jgi:predicted dehydrogenase
MEQIYQSEDCVRSGKACVVGYGSIGMKHVRVLRELGLDVSVVSRRPTVGGELKRFESLSAAMNEQTPDYVVIANDTSDHFDTINELVRLDFRGSVLVEKPLFDRPKAIPPHRFRRLHVGYQLRLHPALRDLRSRLSDHEVILADVYVGQHLATWREGRGVHDSYSARIADGGGVLRDLSHELDYVGWIFGGWTSLCARGGNFGALGIDADEAWTIVMAARKCPLVTLQANYLDDLVKRELRIVTRTETICVDLIGNTLRRKERTIKYELEPSSLLKGEHEQMLADNDVCTLCSAREGLDVLNTIEAVERANSERVWVSPVSDHTP